MKNKKGRNSLIVCIIGLITIQTLIYLKYLNEYWIILLAGFEAGTIGGIADWFAVKALFREIPIPFVRKHTNIIVKNREKISLGIVDLVTNQWLSPQVIHEKIADIKITGKLLNTINVNEIAPFLKQILNKFTSNLETEKLNNSISEAITTELQKLKPGIYLGEFIKKGVNSDEYQKLWEAGLDSVEKIVSTDETKNMIMNSLETESVKYKNESTLKGLLLSIGEGSKVVDYDSLAAKLINVFNDVITNAKNDPDDSLRKNIDNRLHLFAEKLINEDSETTKIVDNLKNTLATGNDTNKIVSKLISHFKELLNDKINNNSEFDTLLEKQIEQFFESLKLNIALQLKIDGFLKDAIEKLITENHHEIGKMVETSLTNLEDKDLVGQIEDKVGDDLQYIRLNGAIVGGFVGIMIAVFRMFFGLL